MEERTDAPGPVRDAVGGRRTYQNADLVFERHYYDYQLALREVQTEAARRIAEIQERFADAIDRAHGDWGRSAQDAYDQYLAVSRGNPLDEGDASDTDAQDAYRQYARTFDEEKKSAQKTHAEAAEVSQRAIRDVQSDVCDAWDAAFRDYIRDVRSSWGDIVIENVTPASVYAISQTMIAAATSAYSAEQVGGRRPESSSDERVTEEGEPR